MHRYGCGCGCTRLASRWSSTVLETTAHKRRRRRPLRSDSDQSCRPCRRSERQRRELQQCLSVPCHAMHAVRQSALRSSGLRIAHSTAFIHPIGLQGSGRSKSNPSGRAYMRAALVQMVQKRAAAGDAMLRCRVRPRAQRDGLGHQKLPYAMQYSQCGKNANATAERA